jgi:hypothetical protein
VFACVREMLSLRICSRPVAISKTRKGLEQTLALTCPRNVSQSSPRSLCFCSKPIEPNGLTSASSTSENHLPDDSPLSGTPFPLSVPWNLKIIYIYVCVCVWMKHNYSNIYAFLYVQLCFLIAEVYIMLMWMVRCRSGGCSSELYIWKEEGNRSCSFVSTWWLNSSKYVFYLFV